MNLIDRTLRPYNQRYDPSKRYSTIMQRPGRLGQSREMMDLQAMMLDFMKRLSDTFFKDGDIVSGCQLALNSQRTIARILPGYIYLGGLIYSVNESIINITGSGEEVLGVILIEEIVTYNEDPELRDPAVGYSSAGMEGADRIRYTVEFKYNDPDALTIYRLVDGELFTQNETPELSAMESLLARRTYDLNDNCRVRGLEVSVSDVPKSYEAGSLVSYIDIVVSSGKAYIVGREINKTSSSFLRTPVATGTKSINGEIKTYDKSISKYLLNKKFVKDITDVEGRAVFRGYVTRGPVAYTSDPPPKNNLIDILVINQGGAWNYETNQFEGGTTFTKGIDFQVADGEIDWSIAPDVQSQPAPGSSYQIVEVYNRHFIKGLDYKLTYDSTLDRWYLDFGTGESNATTPQDQASLSINYDWYLSRRDLVVLNKEGGLRVIQGQYAVPGFAVAPSSDVYDLQLAIIDLPPNSKLVKIYQLDNLRLRVSDLHNMLKRLNALEYNLAMTELDTQAEAGELATNLRGILTDNFSGFTKADVSHPDFDVTLNVFTKEIRIPLDSTPIAPTVNSALSTILVNDRTFTVPFVEQSGIFQLLASESININPYMVFSAKATLSLRPSSDNWVDTEQVSVPVSLTTTDQINLPIQFIDEWWTDQFQRELVSVTSETDEYTTEAIQMFESAVPFMRIRDVEVIGNGFTSQSELKATFDGKPINLTPTGDTIGSDGKIMTDTLGAFTAKFTIPENTPCGQRPLIIFNDQNFAEQLYTGVGFSRMMVGSTVSVTNVTETFQDTVGSMNRILEQIAQQALDIGTRNEQRLNDLEDRVTSIESQIASIYKSLDDIYLKLREIQETADSARQLALQNQAEIELLKARTAAVEALAQQALQLASIADAKADAAQELAMVASLEASEAMVLIQELIERLNELEAAYSELTQVTTDLQIELNKSINQINQLTVNQFNTRIININTTVVNLTQQVTVIQNTVNQPTRTQPPSGSRAVDPLSQSFSFRKDTLISSIEVAFRTKGSNPVTVQIRELDDGGQPTLITLFSKLLFPDDIITSEDGSVMTKIDCDDPVLVLGNKQYVISLLTEDTQYQVFTATLGEKDLVTNEIIGVQPYSVGVLFSSSNNISWTIHQKTDLKFRLNMVSSYGDGVIVFDPMSTQQASDFILLVDQIVPAGTKIQWEYKTDNSDWIPFSLFNNVTFSALATSITLKATLSSRVNDAVVPIILKDTISAVRRLRQSTASYITRNVVMDEAFNTVRQVLEIKAPTNTSGNSEVTPQFSIDDGLSWINNKMIPNPVPVGHSYYRYEFETKLTRNAPTLSKITRTPLETNGTLINGSTYYYRITGTNQNGETVSVGFSVVIPGSSGSTGSVSLDFTGSLDSGLTGYKVYRGTSQGSETLKYVKTSEQLIWTDDGSDTDTAVDTPPTENTATYTASNFRGRVNLSTPSPVLMPSAKKFINIMKMS